MIDKHPKTRIGVDGYNLAMARGTGVATYARNLCSTIADAGYGLDLVYGLTVPRSAPIELRETLFFARLGDDVGDAASQPTPTLKRMIRRAMTMPIARDLLEIPVNGRVISHGFAERLPAADRLFSLGSIFDVSARYFRRYKRFMTLRMPDPPAIMHWTYPLPLRLAGARNIYTVHDLVPLRLPHTSLEDKQYYNQLIGTCIRDAAHIVTVSDASRRDILQLFPADPAKVTNTFQSTDARVEDEGDEALDRRLDRLFDLKRSRYFLFFGAIEPKKNIGRLIEAYLSAELDSPLIIVGGRGWRSEQELRLLGSAHGGTLSATRNIRQMDYLPRPLLMELIRGARAVIFPSLYEGFGLPALEALALGVPVLAADSSSLPEVVGDAALLIDPYDVGAITLALKRLDDDPALRSSLAAAGPLQARKFSAEQYGRTMRALYELIVRESQPAR